MAGLNREAIVDAAFVLLADGGLAAITARSLAAQLGVRPGALYYHLADMAALRDEMATVIMRELILPGSPDEDPAPDWQSFLGRLGRHVRTVLLRYQDGARLFSGTRLTDDEAIGAMETPLHVLTSAGFSLGDALRSVQTLNAFVIGHVIEEQHRSSMPERYTATERHDRLDAARFPLTDAATDAFLEDPQQSFEWGVDALIAGIATRLPG